MKQIHSTCVYNYRQHVGTLREYVCYVGRLKGSMYLVNARLVVRIAAKTQQIRGWTSEMLPIACKQKGRGCYQGTHTIGGVGTRNTRPHIIYIVICTHLCTVALYIYVMIDRNIKGHINEQNDKQTQIDTDPYTY